MNLYLLSQDTNNDWDTFDSMVISAKSHHEAKKLSVKWFGRGEWVDDTKLITSKLLGRAETKENEVICASFNAG